LQEIHGPVSTGKEAVVLRAKSGEGECALKVYRLTPSFRATKKYFTADPRYDNPKVAKMRSDRRSLIMEWAKKEHHNLSTARRIGIPVAQPLFAEANVLAMEFLGEEGIPYPTFQKASSMIRDRGIDRIQLVWERVHDGLTKMAKHGFVHGDLSPYNILYDDEGISIYFIDISQSYISREGIHTEDFFRSDVLNISGFFQRLGVQIEPLQIYRSLIEDAGVEDAAPRRHVEIEEEGYAVQPIRIPRRLDEKLITELGERAGVEIRIDGSLLRIESSSPQRTETIRRVVEAVERGFPHRTALRLVFPDVIIESIHARSMFRSKKKVRRQISRIIGRKGEVIQAIEKHSGADIFIKGSRINLVGTALQVQLATRAIEAILEGYGQEHSILRLKEFEKAHYFELHPFWGDSENAM
jgi:RIO kinase 1